jgi:hypothetical protein
MWKSASQMLKNGFFDISQIYFLKDTSQKSTNQNKHLQKKQYMLAPKNYHIAALGVLNKYAGAYL